MLMGEHAHTIDAKGRIILPAEFREDLGERFVITRGFDTCLSIYSEADWQVLTEKLKSMPVARPEVRMLSRVFVSVARVLDCDRQGRFLVPGNLRKFALLEKDVVLAGVINRVEVWSKAEWERYNDAVIPSISTMAESLAELGF